MSYQAKTDWKYDETVTEKDLNRIEQGVKGAHEKSTQNEQGLAAHLEEFAQHIEDETAHGIGDKSALKTVEKGTIVNALNELFTNVSDGKLLVGRAITDVDDKVNVPTDPTFQELANAIGRIHTGKKYATGNYSATSNQESIVEFRNLKFKPRVLIITFKSNTEKFIRPTIAFYQNINSSDFTNNISVTKTGETTGDAKVGGLEGVTLYSNGFSFSKFGIPSRGDNEAGTGQWYAFE